MPPVNYLAVLVAGILIFALGGVWFSKALFARRWMALYNRTDEQIQKDMENTNMGAMLAQVFVCGLLTAFAMVVIIDHFPPYTITRGIEVAALCWLGFAGVTSYGTNLFSMKPKGLWIIESGYNLVAFILAAIVLTVWR